MNSTGSEWQRQSARRPVKPYASAFKLWLSASIPVLLLCLFVYCFVKQPQGTLEVGVFLAPGESETGVMYAGDLGFAPRGSGHYLKNIGKDWAYVVLIFNAGAWIMMGGKKLEAQQPSGSVCS